MQFQLVNERFTLHGRLFDNSWTKALSQQLPLKQLLVEDYAGCEKIMRLPKKLAVSKSAAGHAARAGELCYYSPWGNLCLFYKDFRYADGLVLLGQVHEPVQNWSSIDDINLNFQLLH
ncbi:cyclophilin-like fold protein [Saprospira sp. CCB-QB6]|uniref:cyclophilin-like fold protein n=1 Tax=Saprospira sp. CCB-QB6 TaxID=3023936 RepID=UPI00234B007C|nr:cyclophilin-like fold protein [Saprospira sp. CCB-QB6]WCL81034.1 cyclophilin-like fold protein [Saprospira sp. CCB-QB6]